MEYSWFGICATAIFKNFWINSFQDYKKSKIKKEELTLHECGSERNIHRENYKRG